MTSGGIRNVGERCNGHRRRVGSRSTRYRNRRGRNATMRGKIVDLQAAAASQTGLDHSYGYDLRRWSDVPSPAMPAETPEEPEADGGSGSVLRRTWRLARRVTMPSVAGITLNSDAYDLPVADSEGGTKGRRVMPHSPQTDQHAHVSIPSSLRVS